MHPVGAVLEKLRSRPRLFGLLHAFGFVSPFSQTREDELQCLERWAKGKMIAVEIGTFMGVSAARLAAVLGAEGKLFCVDPFRDGDPVKAIFLRHMRRKGLIDKIVHVGARIAEAGSFLPMQWDFAFVDGDHSYEGIKADWSVVRDRTATGGIAAFHDTIIPRGEPGRDGGAMRFFAEVVANDPDFEIVEQVHTLSVIRRLR